MYTNIHMYVRTYIYVCIDVWISVNEILMRSSQKKKEKNPDFTNELLSLPL